MSGAFKGVSLLGDLDGESHLPYVIPSKAPFRELPCFDFRPSSAPQRGGREERGGDPWEKKRL